MPRILIIEDDPEINRLLADFLTENGYEPVCLFDGLHVSEVLKDGKVDLILLDIFLPYKKGDRILSEIRTHYNIPVIVISAKGSTQNKIELLRMGADDYITKPFDLEETLARIESNLRRARFQKETERPLQYKALTLDTEKRTVFARDKELTLTAKEYGILELLMRYQDKIFSKANLYQSVWDSEYFSEDNTLNVHISNLRNKIKAVCPDEEYIDTVWGIGYRLHKS